MIFNDNQYLETLKARGVITVAPDGVVRLTEGAWRTMTNQPVIHFIGFKRNAARLHNAVKVFGPPDFVHFRWDFRAEAEIAPGDVAVFADGDETMAPDVHSFDDSAEA